MSNPFAAEETAALYARGRPDHHPRTVQRLAALLPTRPVGRALDVACGAGASTAALRALAYEVVGVDVVPAMISVARAGVDAPFAVAAAELLPFRDRRFGLVCTTSAAHWFDQPAFFAEALRVLEPGGVVAVAEHFFLGEMDGSDGFGSWIRDAYAVRYPTPPRGQHLSVTEAVPAGLDLVGRDGWPDPIELTAEQLVDYLLTQSNTVAVVDRGQEARGAVRAWLSEQVAPFFDGEARTLQFWGSAACYRRAQRLAT